MTEIATNQGLETGATAGGTDGESLIDQDTRCCLYEFRGCFWVGITQLDSLIISIDSISRLAGLL
jgi:hypothetical protein